MPIRWTTHRSAAVLALLTVIACALCVSTYPLFGNAWDEPEHIAAGLVLLDRGEYRYDNQHPPLARLAAAIGPYLAGARIHGDPLPLGEAQGREILYHGPASYDTLLTLARVGMLPFLVLLLAATWVWMRRWHGEATALLAVLFLASTPVILGHAAVVALDVPVTALCVASLYLLLRWLQSPTLGRALALGVAVGLAVATKLSALPFIAVAALALLTVRLGMTFVPERPAPVRALPWRRLGTSLLIVAIALTIMIGCYGSKPVYLTTPDLAPSKALDFIAGSHGPLHDFAYRVAARTALPLGFLMVPLNFLGVEWHNEHGHQSFLLGQVANSGWWYFYPIALGVKSTLPLLLFGLGGLAALAIAGWRDRDLYRMAPSVCFLSILLFCCLYSHINIGVRHVLIAYPLLAMGAAYGWRALWDRGSARIVRAALLGALLWQASTLAYAYPDYLAYFNLLAGAHPEHILVDSDLDWGGQDLRRLEHVLAARHVTQLAIGYKGTADLSLEPLPSFTLLRPNQPVTGWVAITMLTLQENRAGYGWLLQYPPVQRIGGSFELYYIP